MSERKIPSTRYIRRCIHAIYICCFRFYSQILVVILLNLLSIISLLYPLLYCEMQLKICSVCTLLFCPTLYLYDHFFPVFSFSFKSTSTKQHWVKLKYKVPLKLLRLFSKKLFFNVVQPKRQTKKVSLFCVSSSSSSFSWFGCYPLLYFY